MALRQVDDALGAPWERPLAGTVDKLVVESELLADNPLGDPSRRPLWVYRPPGVELAHPRPLPTLYVIQGYFGRLDALTSRDGFYAMLVLFIALRIGAPDRLPILMAVVAAGTHAYWVARLALLGGRRRG